MSVKQFVVDGVTISNFQRRAERLGKVPQRTIRLIHCRRNSDQICLMFQVHDFVRNSIIDPKFSDKIVFDQDADETVF